MQTGTQATCRHHSSSSPPYHSVQVSSKKDAVRKKYARRKTPCAEQHIGMGSLEQFKSRKEDAVRKTAHWHRILFI